MERERVIQIEGPVGEEPKADKPKKLNHHYEVLCGCSNCGFAGKAMVFKGTKLEDAECPDCGCKTLTREGAVVVSEAIRHIQRLPDPYAPISLPRPIPAERIETEPVRWVPTVPQPSNVPDVEKWMNRHNMYCDRSLTNRPSSSMVGQSAQSLGGAYYGSAPHDQMAAQRCLTEVGPQAAAGSMNIAMR